jgi:hypothetical protein
VTRGQAADGAPAYIVMMVATAAACIPAIEHLHHGEAAAEDKDEGQAGCKTRRPACHRRPFSADALNSPL